jgi:hypothetical protein
MKKTALAALLLMSLGAAPLYPQSTLLYFELQGVAAYSTAARAFELYSLMAEETMQKPSFGFDLVKRFSGKTRDWGILAVEARLAYNQGSGHRLELQVYNAYLRFKTGFADIWAGHNRPALGLDYALDNHALLLPGPAMLGFTFDRDWGVGAQRDFSWGSAAASLTAGSGMPLFFKGNYLAAFRVSNGVLARDNFSIGASLAGGNVLETIGNNRIDADPRTFAVVGLDATYLWRNLENRIEVLTGRKAGSKIVLLFWRSGLNLLDEGRLKLEAQPSLMRTDRAWSYRVAGGVTYQLTADLSFRSMVQYDHGQKDARFVFQVYYYKGL